MKKDIKKIVEWLCLCSRQTLNRIALNRGYKNVERMSRSKVEQIAYISRVLCSGIPDSHYRITDNATNQILVWRCKEKYMIDYVMRECHFNWADEMERPVHKDDRHELRISYLGS